MKFGGKVKNWGRPKEEKSKVKFIRKNVRSISAWKKSIVKNYQIPQGLKTWFPFDY